MSFGDKPTHIEIFTPMEVGRAIYQVMIDKYYNGGIMKSSIYGGQIHLHPTTILQGDDVQIIIDRLLGI